MRKARESMLTIEAVISLLKQEKLSEADAVCTRILRGEPKSFDALYLLGSIKLQHQNLVEARRLFERAVVVRPDAVQAISALSYVLFKSNLFDDAVVRADQALAILPADAPTWVTRGNALERLDRLDDALVSYDKALESSADNVEALIARGTLLTVLERNDEAVATFGRIPPGPNSINLYRRAILQSDRALFDAAARDFRSWIETAAEPLPGWIGLAICATESCDWQSLGEPRQKLLAAIDAGRAIAPLLALKLSADPAQQFANAQAVARQAFAPRDDFHPAPVSARAKERPKRLRIVYLSPDFKVHPVAYLIPELLERHDRTRFQIIGVSLGPDDGSDIRSRLVAAFDQFHDMHMQSDDAIVALVRNVKADIVIDLAGYTQHARQGILARRLAPVQASYLGYCGTSGSNSIDYLLADRIVVPPEEHRYFSEKLVYLPHSFMVTDTTTPISTAPLTRNQFGLPDEGFVFCCFNKCHKITQPVFDVWLRLLRSVPGSVLWLSGNLGRGQENLRRYLKEQGMPQERLVFAPGVTRDEHFARHRLADLFLDTIPYNAHTTANDALFAGLPVLTVRGPTFVGRVAASMLFSIGLDELVAQDLEEYEKIALALARDRARLSGLVAKLANHQKSHPLFQIDRFRRNIEKAYDEMFDLYRLGHAPRALEIVEDQE
jgi:protein O-GlcNAc transferase